MLVDLKISEYINVLGSDAPAPGGGSAASLSAAQGIALTKMVTALTVGKKKYVEVSDLNEEVGKEAEKLQKDFLAFIDKDTEAFNGVSAVFSMPKETDEDKAKRKEAMQLALKNATKVPFEVMESCLEALKITKKIVGKSNTNAGSDLGVSALNLKAGIQGAWLNVLINIGGIKDEEFVNEYTEKGKAVLNEACTLADEIYNEILKSL